MAGSLVQRRKNRQVNLQKRNRFLKQMFRATGKNVTFGSIQLLQRVKVAYLVLINRYVLLQK